MTKNNKNIKVRNANEYTLTNGVLYPLYLTGDTHFHISNGNEKIGKGIWTFSLLPGDSPLTLKNGVQLTNIEGTCHGCCEGCKNKCYAINAGKRQHNTCIKAWGENTLLAREDMEVFFAEFQNFIDRSMLACIRIHTAGEFFSYNYMKRMNEFAKVNDPIIFYGYTKRFDWLEKLYREEEVAPNFRLNVSIWHKNYSNPLGLPEFIYDDGTEPELKNVVHCPAVTKDGHETGVTCARCRRCWTRKKGDRTAVYAH